MCGICGIVTSAGERPVDGGVLTGMCAQLFHRGPDEEGYFINHRAGLGVRRLSIIDLATGQQPIGNEDGSVWLAFNGEIYNYKALRRQLEAYGHRFKSNSDSEVIVHAYEEFGDECVDHLNGMFAFAVWDDGERRLLLARDRLGIKPLYYTILDGQIVFGSELKAVLAHPETPRDLDQQALDLFLSLEYIPAPRTILRGVNKLQPGQRLVYQDRQARIDQYWDITISDVGSNEQACIEQLSELIEDAVRIRLMSDVPIGAFLSGGLDSSTILAAMSSASKEPVQAFSIGFDDQSYNELAYAQLAAEQFGAVQYTEILKPDIGELAEKLIKQLDEPLADFSIFPTYLVSKLARQRVKVVLSGDGGDEIFAGYDTYVAQRFDAYYRNLPARVRQHSLPRLMALVPPRPEKKGLVNKSKRFVEGAALDPRLQHTRWMIFLNTADKANLYRPWLQAELNGSPTAALLQSQFDQAAQFDALTQLQYVDIKTYLADNILTKVDRMSMAVSLEARVPFLDHRVVEYALSLPRSLKMNWAKRKVALQRAAAGHVPTEILNKPKQGFSIPLKHWLRGPLRPLMLDLLAEKRVRERGYFELQTVTRWIQAHLDGRADHSHRLWALMVLELWQQRTLDGV